MPQGALPAFQVSNKAIKEKRPSMLKSSGRKSFALQRSPVIWLTGLSGSGKTTTAKILREELLRKTLAAEVLDGDELRKTISSELGFSKEDREIHAKRVTFLSDLLSRNGIITIVALISPFRSFRDYARVSLGKFVEVWVKCSIETCNRRDPKGLYKKANHGVIDNMTGMQQAYEPPLSPEITIDTEKNAPEKCAQQILDYLIQEGHIQN